MEKTEQITKTSIKGELRDQYGISFNEVKEMSDKIIGYTTDREMKIFLTWLKQSGLGSKDLIALTIGNLRKKDFKTDYLMISKGNYKTFLSGDLMKNIKQFLDEKIEELKKMKLSMIEIDRINLFGEIGNNKNTIYNTIQKRFTSAYNRMIKEEYPQYIDAYKKVFTLHSFRFIFKQVCKTLDLPLNIKKLFMGQKQDLDEKKLLDTDLWKDFKRIQENISEIVYFEDKINQTTSEVNIIKRFTEKFLNVLKHQDKRITIFNQYGDAKLEVRNKKFTIDLYINVLVQKLLENMKTELLNDPNFLKEIAKKIKDLA